MSEENQINPNEVDPANTGAEEPVTGFTAVTVPDPVPETEEPEEKTLDAVNIEDVVEKVSDVEVFGNGDLFQLLSKASSEKQGWMKSTKAMTVDGVGAVVQVTTQQKNADGTYSVAEAVTFVPGVKVGKSHKSSKVKSLVKI